MKHAYAIILGLGAALVITTLAVPAQAQGSKTYASIFGSNGNDCLSGPTACRTAQRAIDQTNPGGEVVFDSAGDFFTATVSKPITLNFIHHGQMDQPSDGGPNTANLLINPPNDSDNVTIRGLHMNVLQRNANGIQVNSGNLMVLDSLIQNVGGSNRSGILFQPNGNSRVVISDTTISNAPFGITIAGRNGSDLVGIVDDSIFTGNDVGIRSIPPAGVTHNVLIQNSTFSGNGGGIQSNTSASNLRVKDSTVFGNTTGLARPGGGLIITLGGNSVTGNTTNGSFNGSVDPQ